GVTSVSPSSDAMSSYSVVAFRGDDPRAESNWLTGRGRLFMVASNRRSAGHDPLPPSEHVEVVSRPESMPESMRAELESMGVWYDPPNTYPDFAKVYFLNDAAIRMFRDNGVELPVLETVEEDAVPSRFGPSLSCPYVFQDSANRSENPEAAPKRERAM